MQLRFAVMFSLITMSSFVTSDVSAQAPPTRSFAEKAVVKMHQKFSFDIIAAPCYIGGTSLKVQVQQPEKYAFRWEVNGTPVGNHLNIECACGEYAKVQVKRLADVQQVTRTVKLEKCGGSNNWNNQTTKSVLQMKTCQPWEGDRKNKPRFFHCAYPIEIIHREKSSDFIPHPAMVG